MGGVSAIAIFKHSPCPSPLEPQCHSRHPGEPSIINTCICDKSACFEAGTGSRNWLSCDHTRWWVQAWPRCQPGRAQASKDSPCHFNNHFQLWEMLAEAFFMPSFFLSSSLPLHSPSPLTCSLGSFSGSFRPGRRIFPSPWATLKKARANSAVGGYNYSSFQAAINSPPARVLVWLSLVFL